MEYDLFHALSSSPDIYSKAVWLQDIMRGIDFLHHLNIAHRDIKPENILIRNGNAKVADFGLSEIMTIDKMLQTTARSGSLQYVAPEVLFTDDAVRGDLADRWSLAVTAFVLMFEQFPYSLPGLARCCKEGTELKFTGVVNIPHNIWVFIESNMRISLDRRGHP